MLWRERSQQAMIRVSAGNCSIEQNNKFERIIIVLVVNEWSRHGKTCEWHGRWLWNFCLQIVEIFENIHSKINIAEISTQSLIMWKLSKETLQ